MKNELKKGSPLQRIAEWFRDKTRGMTEEQAL